MMVEDFQCVICQRFARVHPWYSKRGILAKPPICLTCEEVTYHSWNGGARRPSGTRIYGGTRGDRRAAQRLFAIAEAIEWEASHLERSHNAARA